jgi:excisionase family DNA binding protein
MRSNTSARRRTATLALPIKEREAPAVEPWLITIAQLCELTAWSTSTIKRALAADSIPGVCRMGKSVRFDVQAVREWIRAGCPRVNGNGGPAK